MRTLGQLVQHAASCTILFWGTIFLTTQRLGISFRYLKQICLQNRTEFLNSCIWEFRFCCSMGSSLSCRHRCVRPIRLSQAVFA